jgi:hypothetical protein
MNIDYILWFHGGVKDKSILEPNRKKYGFANFDHGIKEPTSKWQIGEVYRHGYTRNINSGEYNFRFGFYKPMEGENEVKRLKNIITSEHGVSIGWKDIY